MGASIYTSVMVLPSNAAAITTLDSLESESNRIGQNIPHFDVGESPRGIAVDDSGDHIAYVTNQDSNAVSVINETIDYYSNYPNSKANIAVGDGPVAIAVDGDDHIAYVTNSADSISIISGTGKQVQAGISFDVNPFHAGRIECNDIAVPTNQYFYVDFRTQCMAQTNEGFQFSNWIENLGSNSRRTISASQGDWFTNTLDWLMNIFGRESNDTPATLNVTKFGTFMANFDSPPSTVPPEYVATLFTVVVTAFVGSWLTPSFIEQRKAKKQGNKLDHYHKEVKHLYKDGKLDKNDIDDLDKLRNNIIDEYTRGKINKEQFDK